MASGIVNICSASQFRRQRGQVGSLPKKEIIKIAGGRKYTCDDWVPNAIKRHKEKGIAGVGGWKSEGGGLEADV